MQKNMKKSVCIELNHFALHLKHCKLTIRQLKNKNKKIRNFQGTQVNKVQRKPPPPFLCAALWHMEFPGRDQI